MANDMTIENGFQPTHMVLGGSEGTVYMPGELIGYSGGWVKACAATGSAVEAHYICGEQGVAGQTITAYRAVNVIDSTAPFTPGSRIWLSRSTPGRWTHTMPATSGDLVQCLGVASSVNQAQLNCQGAPIDSLVRATADELSKVGGFPPGGTIPICESLDVREVAAAGVYVGTINLPEQALVEEIIVRNRQPWGSSTSAVLKVGDDGDDDGYLKDVNLLTLPTDVSGLGGISYRGVGRLLSQTATNVTPDRAFDANSTIIDEIADILGTLESDLKGQIGAYGGQTKFYPEAGPYSPYGGHLIVTIETVGGGATTGYLVATVKYSRVQPHPFETTPT
jgi:hypothetical protein